MSNLIMLAFGIGILMWVVESCLMCFLPIEIIKPKCMFMLLHYVVAINSFNESLNLFRHKVQIHCHPLHVYALVAIVGNIRDDKTHIKNGKIKLNMHHYQTLLWCCQPIVFPPHLAKNDNMAKWVKKFIQTHQDDVRDFHLLMKILPYFQFLQVSQHWSTKKWRI